MPLRGIANAEQLAELTRLLDEFSKEVGIENDRSARERLALRIMSLFKSGITKPEDIKRHLNS